MPITHDHKVTLTLSDQSVIPIERGSSIKNFRGETYVFLKVTRPAEPGRSAKVMVERIPTLAQAAGHSSQPLPTFEFYAQVFPGLTITSTQITKE